MKFKDSELSIRHLKSHLQTFLVRVGISLMTFSIGYSSMILSQKILFSSPENKADTSANILQADSLFSPDLIRPSYPPQFYNRKTGQWEVMKPDETKLETESEKLLPQPPVMIEKK